MLNFFNNWFLGVHLEAWSQDTYNCVTTSDSQQKVIQVIIKLMMRGVNTKTTCKGIQCQYKQMWNLLHPTLKHDLGCFWIDCP